MSASASDFPLLRPYADAIDATARLPIESQVPAISDLLFAASSRGQFVAALISVLVAERAGLTAHAATASAAPS